MFARLNHENLVHKILKNFCCIIGISMTIILIWETSINMSTFVMLFIVWSKILILGIQALETKSLRLYHRKEEPCTYAASRAFRGTKPPNICFYAPFFKSMQQFGYKMKSKCCLMFHWKPLTLLFVNWSMNSNSWYLG